MEKIDNYLEMLYLSEELNVYQEGLGDIIKKFTAEKAKALLIKIKNFAETKDIKGMQNLFKATGLSRVKLPTIDNYMTSKYNEYGKIRDFSRKVLKNSLRGKPNKKLLEAASVFLAVSSFIPERKGAVSKPKKDSKMKIREFVSKYNSFYDEHEQPSSDSTLKLPKESIPDYVLGITVIMTLVGFLGFGMWIVYSNLTLIAILISISVIASLLTAFAAAAKA